MRTGSSDNTPSDYVPSLTKIFCSSNPAVVQIFLIKLAAIGCNEDTPFSEK